ncbi:MAG: hypothetical protein WCW65_01625 [Candidatus Paceibacterota bacterium]
MNVKQMANKIWIIITLVIIANIFLFSVLSKKLESYVVDTMIEEHDVELQKLLK